MKRLLLVLLASPASGWTVWAGTSGQAPPDLTNVSTAMRSAYRFQYKVPLLRYAISPDFCAAISHLLIEQQSSTVWLSARWTNFTSCERIKSVIRDAFDTWSAANPVLQFVDVSGRCEAERMWRPIPDERCAESQHCVDLELANETSWYDGLTALEQLPNQPTWLCSHRTCFECDRADVIVGAFTQKNRRLGDIHAAARVQRNITSDATPNSPSGLPALGKTLFRAFLEFNVDEVYKNLDSDPNNQGNETLDNCWRLDNDVCDYVIGLQLFDDGNSFKNAVLTYFWIVFAALSCGCFCVFLNLMQRLAANLLTGWDVDNDGKLEMQEILYVLDEFCGEVLFNCKCPTVHQKKMSPLSGCLSMLETIVQTSLLLPAVMVMGMVSLGVLYVDAVMPCFYCRDLRASAIHEIGHLLSLDHSTGQDGTVPLSYNPKVATPAPPPPPVDDFGVTIPLFELNEPYDKNWSSVFSTPDARCEDPLDGVFIDPIATEMLNPPPPPTPPPESPPPPMLPNETYAPPPARPPALPPNSSMLEVAMWWDAFEKASTWQPPLNITPIDDASHNGKMGSLVDLNSSVMMPFGSTGLERPGAGRPRRCLDVDDLNGVHFLYPPCGTPRLPEPVCEYVLEYEFAGQRLIESWLKVMLLPAVLFIGLKVFAIGFLFLEDVIAAYKVRAQARKLLKEAEEAEAHRQSQLAALPEAEEEPPPPAKEKAPSAISRSSMMKSYFK